MLKLESIFLLRHRGKEPGMGTTVSLSLSFSVSVSLSLSLSFAREASTGLLQGRRKILVVARVDGTALLRSSDSSCGSDFWGS